MCGRSPPTYRPTQRCGAWRTEAGDLDILVNNAGAIPPGDLLSVDDEKWRHAWDLKVFGYISFCRAVYAQMKPRRAGVIVNVIGAAGESFPTGYIAGAAGNASLMAFTRALGKGAPADGLRVVAINPGPVETDRLVMLRRAEAQAKFGDPERWRELSAGMPFGRAGKAGGDRPCGGFPGQSAVRLYDRHGADDQRRRVIADRKLRLRLPQTIHQFPDVVSLLTDMARPANSGAEYSGGDAPDERYRGDI